MFKKSLHTTDSEMKTLQAERRINVFDDQSKECPVEYYTTPRGNKIRQVANPKQDTPFSVRGRINRIVTSKKPLCILSSLKTKARRMLTKQNAFKTLCKVEREAPMTKTIFKLIIFRT